MSTFNNTPISINHLAEDQIKMYKQEITNVFFFFFHCHQAQINKQCNQTFLTIYYLEHCIIF